MKKFNTFLDHLSDFLSKRKGLVPLLGIVLVVVNLLLSFFPGLGWIAESNLFLHVGVIMGLLGFMIAWAL